MSLKQKYMRTLIIILFFASINIFSQEMKILDEETNSAVPNARVISGEHVFYTNDDGIVYIPNKKSTFNISAAGFSSKTISAFSEVVLLKPLYQQIEEVQIKAVNLEEIFKKTIENYDNAYYTSPSQYNITFKQKNKINGNISFLFVFDGSFWSKYNKYNGKYAITGEYDNFVQMGIDKVRFLKRKEIKDNELKNGALDFSRQYVSYLFFNYDLLKISKWFKLNRVKHKARIIKEENGEQLIDFTIEIPDDIKIIGNLNYNTIDKAITHFDYSYDQSSASLIKKKTSDGSKYDFKLGNGRMVYDFYKKDNFYVPSAVLTEGEGFTSTYGDEKFVSSFKREIVFNYFYPQPQPHINNKVDLTKKIWENVPKIFTQEKNIVLSNEEKKFIENN